MTEPTAERPGDRQLVCVVADETPVWAAGLAAVLAATVAGSVVVVTDVAAAGRTAAAVRADVVLAGFPLLQRSLDVARLVAPRPSVVLHWTTRAADRAAVRASGARGFASKDLPVPDLLALIRAVANGETRLHEVPRTRTSEEHLRRADDPVLLTDREFEVVRLVLEGLATKQVAARLGIAPQTAKNHLSRAMAKAGVTSRVQLFAWSSERRLFESAS